MSHRGPCNSDKCYAGRVIRGRWGLPGTAPTSANCRKGWTDFAIFATGWTGIGKESTTCMVGPSGEVPASNGLVIVRGCWCGCWWRIVGGGDCGILVSGLFGAGSGNFCILPKVGCRQTARPWAWTTCTDTWGTRIQQQKAYRHTGTHQPDLCLWLTLAHCGTQWDKTSHPRGRAAQTGQFSCASTRDCQIIQSAGNCSLRCGCRWRWKARTFGSLWAGDRRAVLWSDGWCSSRTCSRCPTRCATRRCTDHPISLSSAFLLGQSATIQLRDLPWWKYYCSDG